MGQGKQEPEDTGGQKDLAFPWTELEELLVSFGRDCLLATMVC